MINSLELVNFQTHKKSKFEFHPGINIITGKSDEGKSSVIRAIYWLLFNKPSGNEFINWNAKKCSVTMTVNENEIVREKSNGGTNKYIVNGTEYNATRTDVPDQVKEHTRLNGTNIQMQDDPYFMLSLNSGDVARKLNEVVGLNQIDSSMRYVNGVYRKSVNSVNHIQEDINRLENDLERYKELDSIINLYNKYVSFEEKYDHLESLLDTIEKLIEDLSRLTNIKEKSTILEELSNRIEEYQKKEEELSEIEDNTDELEDIVKTIKEDSNRILILSETQDKAEELLEKLLALVEEEQSINKNIDEIGSIVEMLNSISEKMKQTKADLQKSEEQFQKFKQTIKECPLCERPFF